MSIGFAWLLYPPELDTFMLSNASVFPARAGITAITKGIILKRLAKILAGPTSPGKGITYSLKPKAKDNLLG